MPAWTVRRLWIAAGFVLIAFGQASAEGRGQGAQVAATCAACHRLDGGVNGIPSIVGIEAGRLVGMMQAFKVDEGSNHVMHAVALSLSDDEIAAVAQHLATLGRASPGNAAVETEAKKP